MVVLDDLHQSRSWCSLICIIPSRIGLLSPSCPISEQDENMTCPWPWMTLNNLVLNGRFILLSRPDFFNSPSLGPIGATYHLTWPLALPDLESLGAPNKHNKLTLPRTKLQPSTKFHKSGTYHLRENSAFLSQTHTTSRAKWPFATKEVLTEEKAICC